jgi:hypothetical protein
VRVYATLAAGARPVGLLLCYLPRSWVHASASAGGPGIVHGQYSSAVGSGAHHCVTACMGVVALSLCPSPAWHMSMCGVEVLASRDSSPPTLTCGALGAAADAAGGDPAHPGPAPEAQVLHLQDQGPDRRPLRRPCPVLRADVRQAR